MSISVKCTDCGKALKAPDALAGKNAKCPDCGAIVPIPKVTIDAEEIHDLPAASFDDEFDSSANDSKSRKPCPLCGEMIAVAAAKCRYCGEIFDSRMKKSGRRRNSASDDYAGFWLRLVASFVDGLICSVVLFVVLMIVGGIMVAINGPNDRNEPGPVEIIGGFVIWAVAIVFPWLYSAFQESSPAQATLGKKMLGIQVTDLDGNRISFGQASGRHFGKILSNLVCSIGFIMAGLTEKKQALHDMLAGTLVVRN